LEAAHKELVRTKTFEAIASATIEAIHWIGNKALPISTAIKRLRTDVDRLPEEPDLLDSIREDLALIENSAQLIVSVREHLIGPAREEIPRPSMVSDVIKDTAVSMGIPADVIIYSIPDAALLGVADTTQLSRAFAYVLKNSLEAMEEADEKRIAVEVAPTDDDFVVVRIADTGPGISEEDRDKIWAAFYTTKGAGHAGLGLSATLQILRQIDGQVRATNNPDGGATVELLIPIFAGDLPTAEFASDRSLLLIDDDDLWSRFALGALQDAGMSVTHSADGEVDPTKFDLILVDGVLEMVNSRTVLKKLVKAGVTDRLVVLLSSLRVEQAMDLMHLGVKDISLKPYTADGLKEIVG
jgi:BarA-like signal transduction histidine kinase